MMMQGSAAAATTTTTTLNNLAGGPCIVELIFRDSTPLGIAVCRRPRHGSRITGGVVASHNSNAGSGRNHNTHHHYNDDDDDHRNMLHVWELIEGCQGERLAVTAMLEPQVFADSNILAVNGIRWNNNDDDTTTATGEEKEDALWKELRSPQRPKSVVFLLQQPRNKNPQEAYESIRHSVGVNRIYDDFVELVFHTEQIMGIVPAPPSTTATTMIASLRGGSAGGAAAAGVDNTFLRVKELAPQGEAAALARQLLLEAADFGNAKVIAVNGKAYPNRTKTIRAIQNSTRPASILFQLDVGTATAAASSQGSSSSSATDPNTRDSSPMPRLFSEIYAATRVLSKNAPDGMTTTTSSPASSPSRNSVNAASHNNSSSPNRKSRRLSTLKRENAVLASMSMRALLAEEEGSFLNRGTNGGGSPGRTGRVRSRQQRLPSIRQTNSRDDDGKDQEEYAYTTSGEDKKNDFDADAYIQQKISESTELAEKLNAEIIEQRQSERSKINHQLLQSAEHAEMLNAEIEQNENEALSLQRRLSESSELAEKLNAENEQKWNKNTSDYSVTATSFDSAAAAASAPLPEESQLTFRAREIMHRFRSLELGVRSLEIGGTISNGLRKLSRGASDSSSNNNDSGMVDDLDFGEDPEVLRKQAYEACLAFIREHLEAFIEETPNVTYEEWIEEIHPENARIRQSFNNVLTVDHRFYVEGSDHRKIWNANLDGVREFVPVRIYTSKDNHEKTPPVRRASWVQDLKLLKSFRRSGVYDINAVGEEDFGDLEDL